MTTIHSRDMVNIKGSCRDCRRPMITRHMCNRLAPALRAELHQAGVRVHDGYGMCRGCSEAARRAGSRDPVPRKRVTLPLGAPCLDCGRPTVPRARWRVMPQAERLYYAPRRGRGLCSTDYQKRAYRQRKGG